MPLGNVSIIDDGAALARLACEAARTKYARKPKGRLISLCDQQPASRSVSICTDGVIERVCIEAGIALDPIDLFEPSTAFSAVALMSISLLKLGRNKVKIKAGAISIGHPIGAAAADWLRRFSTGLPRPGVAKVWQLFWYWVRRSRRADI